MKNERGFTLLEVLIAIVIFALGILAIGNMQLASVQTSSLANRLTEASIAAQDQIEKLLGASYTNTVLNDTDHDGTDQDTNNDGIDDQGPDTNFGLNDNSIITADHHVAKGQYTILWNVAVDYPVPGTKTVRIFVTWNERGRQKQVVFDLVKSRM
ncbi:MAG: hypothetical protein DRG59_07420 [Deltaproteobacteria bacterium]|nr:MAG: hypothetical protein DRG59_07420 [Deltaproteobacteria bacterium]